MTMFHIRQAAWKAIIVVIVILIYASAQSCWLGERDHYYLFLLFVTMYACAAFFLQRHIFVFNTSRLSIPGFWFIAYTFLLFLPMLFMTNDYRSPYNIRFALSVASATISVPVGIVIASAVFRYRNTEIEEHYLKPLDNRDNAFYFKIFFPLFAVIALSMTTYYIMTMENIPLLLLLANTGDASSVLESRSEATGGISFGYLFFVLRSMVYPLLLSYALLIFVVKRKWIWFLAFIFLLLSGIGTAMVTTSKSQVVAIFVVLILSLHLHSGGIIKVRHLLLFICLALVFPFAIFLLLYSEGGMRLAFNNLVMRIFMSPAEVLYNYFEVFPDHVGFLHGRSIGKLAALLDLNFFDATKYVSAYMNSFTLDYGSANAGFMGDAYANFGFTGVLVEGSMLGFILQGTELFIIRRRKHIFGIALNAFLLYEFTQMNTGSLQVTLMSEGIIFSMVLYCIIEKTSKVFAVINDGER